jgi:hypothetical protein
MRAQRKVPALASRRACPYIRRSALRRAEAESASVLTINNARVSSRSVPVHTENRQAWNFPNAARL